MTVVFVKRENVETDTQGEHHVKTRAVTYKPQNSTHH